MDFHDINDIVAGHYGTTSGRIMMPRFGRTETDNIAREAAILLCREVLGASHLKTQRWYNYSQHNGSIYACRAARNLVTTNKTYRRIYKSALTECQAFKQTEEMRKTIKQVYNLNYRVREKGIVVRTRSRTLSISEDQFNMLQGTQVKKLLDKHHYTIQFSLL